MKKLPREIQEEIVRHAETLKAAPMSGEQLKGKYRFMRSLHFGYKGTAYRIIYQVVSRAEMVVVFLADKWENICRKLDRIRL